MDDGKFLTLTEAAAVCGCSVQTIKNWREKRDFPAPVGRNYSEREVLAWCLANGVRTVTVKR